VALVDMLAAAAEVLEQETLALHPGLHILLPQVMLVMGAQMDLTL
jgi:hypothetical protein